MPAPVVPAVEVEVVALVVVVVVVVAVVVVVVVGPEPDPAVDEDVVILGIEAVEVAPVPVLDEATDDDCAVGPQEATAMAASIPALAVTSLRNAGPRGVAGQSTRRRRPPP